MLFTFIVKSKLSLSEKVCAFPDCVSALNSRCLTVFILLQAASAVKRKISTFVKRYSGCMNLRRCPVVDFDLFAIMQPP